MNDNNKYNYTYKEEETEQDNVIKINALKDLDRKVKDQFLSMYVDPEIETKYLEKYTTKEFSGRKEEVIDLDKIGLIQVLFGTNIKFKFIETDSSAVLFVKSISFLESDKSMDTRMYLLCKYLTRSAERGYCFKYKGYYFTRIDLCSANAIKRLGDSAAKEASSYYNEKLLNICKDNTLYPLTDIYSVIF